MNCNKKKTYARLYPCSECGTDVLAIYDLAIKRWDLSCDCGHDTYFETLNKRNWRQVK